MICASLASSSVNSLMERAPGGVCQDASAASVGDSDVRRGASETLPPLPAGCRRYEHWRPGSAASTLERYPALSRESQRGGKRSSEELGGLGRAASAGYL